MNYYDSIKLEIYEAYDNGEITYDEKEYLLEKAEDVLCETVGIATGKDYARAAERKKQHRVGDRLFAAQIRQQNMEHEDDPEVIQYVRNLIRNGDLKEARRTIKNYNLQKHFPNI